MHLSRPLAFAVVLPLAAPLAAQTVQEARNAAIGSTVSFTAIVTSGAGLGPVRYMQDATAGIAVFPGSGSMPGFAPQPGDRLQIQGVLTNYNGLLEVTPIAQYTLTGTGQPLPAAQVITPDGLDEAVEGRIVRIEDARFTGSGTFTSGSWEVEADGQTAQVYLRDGHPLLGTPVPSGPVDLIGIASQYDPSSPYTSGYQLLPRSADDLLIDTGIAILPPVTQSAIVPDGFTLAWQTTVPGTSQVRYGTTPLLGSVAGEAAPATAHAAVLSGLQPATAYYAQAFSVDGADTAFSDMGLYSTASNSSGVIRVYFNKSVDTGVSSGVDAVGLFQATDDTIKAYIDRAQSTLDVAMYNTNSSVIVAAVNAALTRGVQVRWIAEGSNENTALDQLNEIVPVLYREDDLGSGMHDKFFIIDADSDMGAWVLSGSLNWTTQNMFNDYNNIVLVQDQALARCYRAEFEEMWGGSGAQPVAAQSRFGPAKTDNTPHLFNIGGVEVESRFSPTDHVTDRIQDMIDGAGHSVHMALYVFTQNDLADALVDAHDRPGMTVRGDMEDVYTIGSEFGYLVGQGIEMYSHDSEAGLLHHKYAIIDEGTPDAAVVTGSHNWTTSAEELNDENMLIIRSPLVANLFYQEWTARHAAVSAVEEREREPLLAVRPNPAREGLWIKAGVQRGEVIVQDAVGRVAATVAFQAGAPIILDGLQAGAYTFTLVAGGRTAGTGRFIKE